MNESRGRRRSEGPEPGSPEWQNGPPPGSPEWQIKQWNLTEAMVESVKGLDINGEEADPGEFSIHKCHWNDIEIPVIMHGAGGEARPVYFARAYAFHPGTEPITEPGSGTMKRHPPRRGRAFVVDTGWRHRQDHKNYDSAHVDPCNYDVVHGHGPAIVELIEDRAPGADVQLRQVAFDPASKQQVMPIFRDPVSGLAFRGFYEGALVATLKGLKHEVEEGDVVNLSLGAVVCPDMMAKHDPVGDLVRDIAGKVEVVVAAGNHAVDVPSWPAAYAADVDGKGGIEPIPRVTSVGSGRSKQDWDDFSAHGTWVKKWRDGSNVPVNHPDIVKHQGSRPNVLWSGTSFAAPIYAAELLPHV